MQVAADDKGKSALSVFIPEPITALDRCIRARDVDVVGRVGCGAL